VNVRFNDAHSGGSLSAWIEEEADQVAAAFGVGIAATFELSGESFLTRPGPFTDLVGRRWRRRRASRPRSRRAEAPRTRASSRTTARWWRWGSSARPLHQTDERVAVADIETLKRVYGRILAGYFAAHG
jgi:succinyl-diaminopimelate desuccinylase